MDGLEFSWLLASPVLFVEGVHLACSLGHKHRQRQDFLIAAVLADHFASQAVENDVI
jgi:hypothetical protein